MTNILIDARRGVGNSADILYGTVTWKPTLAHSRGTSIVLPAPTIYDLVNGVVVATNVQPTPEPVDGVIEWAYEVTFEDRRGKTYSFLVGVPDTTSQVSFTSLPRYYETKPPLFGAGPKGAPGEAATISLGTVSSGTTPSITNSGTSRDAVFNFVLPKGEEGDKGDKGDPGTPGTNGVDGKDGKSGEVFTESFKTYAAAQGWSNLYLDNGGQLTNGTANQAIVGYSPKPYAFGALSGYVGRAVIPGNANLNRIMVVAEYVKSDTVQQLFSSGANA